MKADVKPILKPLIHLTARKLSTVKSVIKRKYIKTMNYYLSLLHITSLPDPPSSEGVEGVRNKNPHSFEKGVRGRYV